MEDGGVVGGVVEGDVSVWRLIPSILERLQPYGRFLQTRRTDNQELDPLDYRWGTQRISRGLQGQRRGWSAR
jgi:hypothetical protein